MKIEEVENFSDSLLEGINKLIPQLSSSAQKLEREKLANIIKSDFSHLLIATENNEILGMLTLVIFRIPTGVRAWIEDVVVGESSRGKGIGLSMVQSAIQLSKENGAKTVDLTSRPSREAANSLYQKAGFQKRETNVYRYEK